MSKINGYDNEYKFIKYLNGKMVKELNPMYEDLINYLFPKATSNSLIKCWRNHLKQKSDIFIKIDGTMKGISIKKGIKNSVHVEPITEFIHFLIDNGIPQKYIEIYLKYHYADGTTNGSGKKRLSALEYQKSHQSEIDELNKVLNNNDTLVKKAIDRFIIRGNNSIYDIDALIYGEVNDFVWISKDDIRKSILSNKNNYSSSVHIASLTIQPKNRCLNYNLKYNKDRYSVQLKWYNLFDDIILNMYNKINKV